MSKQYINRLISMVVMTSALYSPAILAEMDHDKVQMQGGSAPADARDPHAYSDGHTLTEGPYAQAGPRQLRLADEHGFWAVLGDRVEYNEGTNSTVFDLQGWYGTTYDRFVVKAEGDIVRGQLEESQTDLLWSHAITAYFDAQLGVRLDQYHQGRNRQWLAIGIQGLAPYWFELDVTAYLGNKGRIALALEAEYDLFLTQRLILQPRAELMLYGRNDPDNELGSGLSDLAIGFRLGYQFSRQFTPYIGMEWSGSYGQTADYQKNAGQLLSVTQLVAGFRFLF